MPNQESKSTRKEVFDAIDNERRHQDIRPKAGGTNAEFMSLAGEIICMQRLLYKAMLAYSGETDNAAQVLDVMREATATGFRCLEHYGVTERMW